MKTRHEKWIPWAIVMTLAAVWFIAPREIAETVPAPLTDDALYGFGDTRSVGQEFESISGLHTISIPLKGLEDVRGPLLLHLRKEYFGDDIRTAVAFPPHTGNEAIFAFRRIPLSRELFWVLEAPEDPDKTLSAYREKDTAAYEHGSAYVKGKEIVGNLGFTQVGRQSRVIFIVKDAIQFTKERFVDLRDTYQGPLIWSVALTYIGYRFRKHGQKIYHTVQKRSRLLPLAAVVVASFSLHLWYGQTLPLNNDEGAYLLDAYQTEVSFVPIRDFLTKGPVYIYALKLWSAIVPNSIVWLRVLSAIYWSIAIVCLYRIVSYMFKSRTLGLLAVALAGLSPTVIAVSTPLLLQVMSVAITLAGLVCIIRGIERESWRHFLIAALIMTTAYFTRASSLVVILVGFLFIYLYAPKEKRIQWIGVYAATGLGAAAVVASLAYLGWGLEKMLILFNLEALAISQERIAESAGQDSALRQFVQWSRLFWQSSPWLLVGVFFLPAVLVSRLRGALGQVFAVGIWMLLLRSIAPHWADMSYHMPSDRYLFYAYLSGVFLFVGPLFLSLRLLLQHKKTAGGIDGRNGGVGVLWIFLYGALYYMWGNFVDSYVLEFVPVLIILLLVIMQVIRDRFPFSENKGIYIAGSWFIVFATILSYPILIRYQHTGTMDIVALEKFIDEVRIIVPEGQEIFTGQSAVPALAQRPVSLGYSHPGWYLYEIRGEVPTELREVYFKDPTEVTEYLDTKVQYVVTDRRTNQVYFNSYPKRIEILESKFEIALEATESFDEPFRLYVRR